MLLTVAGCPLRDKLRTDITAAVTERAGGHRRDRRLRRDDRRAAARTAAVAARRAGAGAEPVIPFAQPGSRTRVYAIAQRQGRRGQVERHGQPGRGPGRARARRRGGRRGHLRPLGAADARRRRPADPGRRHDHAAAGARREGHLDRHVHQGERGRGVARPDAAPGAAAVPRRRVLGRPRRPAARPAARHRRRGDLVGPARTERGDPGRDHARRRPPPRWPSGPARSPCRPTSGWSA